MRTYDYVYKNDHIGIKLANVTYIQWHGGQTNSVVVHLIGAETVQLIADDARGAEAMYKELLRDIKSRD
jgi:hypothetical protein